MKIFCKESRIGKQKSGNCFLKKKEGKGNFFTPVPFPAIMNLPQDDETSGGRVTVNRMPEVEETTSADINQQESSVESGLPFYSGQQETEEEYLARLVAVVSQNYTGNFSLVSGEDGLPEFTFFIEGLNWPIGGLSDYFEVHGFGCIYGIAEAVREAIISASGGEEQFYECASVLLNRGMNVDSKLNFLSAGFSQILNSLRTISFDALRHNERLTVNEPGEIIHYAGELSKAVEELTVELESVARLLEIALEQMDGLYVMWLPGKKYPLFLKQGEEEPFIVEREAWLDEQVELVKRNSDKVFSTIENRIHLHQEHKFAAGISAFFNKNSSLDMAVIDKAMNERIKLEKIYFMQKEVRSGPLNERIGLLFGAYVQLKSTSTKLIDFIEMVDQWYNGQMEGGEDAVTALKITTTVCIMVVTSLAGGMIGNAINSRLAFGGWFSFVIDEASDAAVEAGLNELAGESALNDDEKMELIKDISSLFPNQSEEPFIPPPMGVI